MKSFDGVFCAPCFLCIGTNGRMLPQAALRGVYRHLMSFCHQQCLQQDFFDTDDFRSSEEKVYKVYTASERSWNTAFFRNGAASYMSRLVKIFSGFYILSGIKKVFKIILVHQWSS